MSRESATVPSFTPTPPPTEMSTATHLLLIPSYNSGQQVYETVRRVRREWMPVWVIVDGSDDGTAKGLREMAVNDPGLRVIVLSENRGKGAAILHGIEFAAARGFTHVLTMNAAGRYPAERVTEFMAASSARPEAMILGEPVIALRPRNGRRLINWWANLETLWCGIGDAMCGFRVYPIAPLIRVMRSQRWMRRCDFDPEAVVRMAWEGIPIVNLQVPTVVESVEDAKRGLGATLRDRVLLVWMAMRLSGSFVLHLPRMIARRAGSGATLPAQSGKV